VRKLYFFAIVIAMLCLCASVLSANTISYSTSFVDGIGSSTLSVAQFNSALGTLNSVKLDVSSTFTATVTAYKDVDSNQYLTWAVEDPTVTIKAPDNSTIIDQELGWIELVGTQYGPVTGASRIAIPKLPAQYTSTKSLSGSATNTLTSGLTDYIGVGNVVFPYATSVPWFTLSTQGGNNSVGIATVVSTDLVVTYDYTPVPEPSSIIVLVGGLGSLLAFKRRRA
jgi:hypothetical protein